MTNLLLETISDDIFPVVLFGIIFVVFVIIAISAANKKKAEERRRQYIENQRQKAVQSVVKTPHQTEYLDGLRQKKAEQKVVAHGHDAHSHKGSSVAAHSDGHRHVGADEEERYDEIVGSLGDVDDEGCIDLSGVRLIAHDAAYDGDVQQKDYDDVAKAVVLGDIINSPRFKNPYGKR